MKPADPERALASLLRSGRADPTGDDLERLERRLSPWLGAAPTAGHDGRGGHFWKSIVFLATLGLFAPPDVMRSEPTTTTAQLAAPVATTASAIEARETPAVAPSSESTVSVADLPNAPVVIAANVAKAPATPRPVAPAVALTPEHAAEEIAESEASFLRRAQTTLGADPRAALQMLDDHPTRFPRGILVQERDVMAIDALARLGRTDEARARAHAFRSRYPRSAHDSRIASILKEGTP